MDKRQEHDDELLAALDRELADFGLTGKVLAKADETKGEWFYINQLRQRMFRLYEMNLALNRKMNGIHIAQPHVGDTAIYEAFGRKKAWYAALRRKTWGQRATIVGGFVGLAGSAATGLWWVVKMVVKGLQAH